MKICVGKCLIALGLFLVGTSSASAATGKTEADLLLGAVKARPGSTILAGIHLDMPKGWHTYWRNAGDSGEATQIDWDLPQGITPGNIRWPVPDKYNQAGLYTYVYHDEVVLVVPLRVSPEISAGEYSIKASVGWLECAEVCLPGSAELTGRLKIGETAESADDLDLIRDFQKRMPKQDVALNVDAGWQSTTNSAVRALVISAENIEGRRVTDFFPYGAKDYVVQPATDVISKKGERVRLKKRVEKFGDEWPSEIEGLLVASSEKEGYPVGVEVTLSPGSSEKEAEVAQAGEGGAAGFTAGKLLKMIAFALIGGVILNVMPCVLPVISLKILGFVNQSQDEPKRVRKMGLIYTMGVLASFLALASVVIGVQQAGKSAGWGMQLANPYFLMIMTVVVTLVALNLFGVFEIYLTGNAMQAASQASSREGASGAFFSGVLATALATPCTAPFLAVALGFAFLQPPWIIVLIFLVVGLGLAAPYLLLSWKPGWLRFLPKPGPWMERFKIIMGFPMLATAIWLFYLLANHYGRAGVLWIGLFLVILGLVAWIWGTFVQGGARYRRLAVGICAVLLISGYWYTLEGRLQWRSTVAASQEDGMETSRKTGLIDWREWSPEAVKEARQEGHVVLVDFTADWCLTCQVNEETSLEIPSTQKKLEEVNGVAFKADYTSVPERMTKVLQRYDRAGVPLVLVYPSALNREPIVLPQILRPKLVHRKLEQAAEMGNPSDQKSKTTLTSK